MDEHELNETLIDVERLILECRRKIRQDAARAGLEVVVNIQPDMSLIWADRKLLQQAVLNLLSNAVRFTSKGGKVEVNASLEMDGNAVITVSDDGAGMTADEVTRALEPATPSPAGHSKAPERGLPATRRLIEQHGGMLSIVTAKGYGSTIIVRLPAERCRHGGSDESH